jgi:SulP family sulfate permease
MPTRYLDALNEVRTRLGYGLRARLKEGYTRADFRADVLAGLVVGVVALPLSMALAIASKVAPQYGLYTAIIAGVVCALLGGTRAQVTGPTAAFVVILVPIVVKFGFGGLLLAGFMAGILLMVMASLKLGRLITYIPHPVTTGFTAGIAVVIATIQLKDFLGLKFADPESYVDRWHLMWGARHSFAWSELTVGALGLALLLLLPRFAGKRPPWAVVGGIAVAAFFGTRFGAHFTWLEAGVIAAALTFLLLSGALKLPAPLTMLVVISAAVFVVQRHWPGFSVATIGTRFHSMVGGHEVAGIPPLPPLPLLPWHVGGADGAAFSLSWSTIRALAPGAFAIAMLGAIESLLAAVVADGMTGTKHDPNAELFALGVANVICPFFGGIAATGALARTATNIRAGARSPFAAVIHALFILACTIALAPLVAFLPMAALAALLIIVARNMAEVQHFIHVVRVAPRSDVIVLLTCFALTVLFDMVLSVSVGVVLAALLFMRRMSELTDVRLDTGTMTKLDVPDGVLLYEVAGPLFFGAAGRAIGVLDQVLTGDRRKVVILLLNQVPAIDATGLVGLETVLGKLRRGGHKVILTGVRPQVAGVLEKAEIRREPGKIAFAPDIDTALSLAIVHQARADESRAPTTEASQHP